LLLSITPLIFLPQSQMNKPIFNLTPQIYIQFLQTYVLYKMMFILIVPNI